MTTALQTQEPAEGKKMTLKALVESPVYANRFKQVLGDRAPQFVSSLLQVASSTQLRACEPNSVIAAAMTAAALDLPIDKNLGFAHIVPYRNKEGKSLAQFQMGYKGYIQLALRTATYQRMNAKAINSEAFQGFDEVGEPIIDWTKLDETKPAVGYAFAFKLVNGFTKVAYWPKDKVDAHARRYSKAYKSDYDTPWKSNFDKMALKTVIRNELSAWGILSIELRRAMQEDQGVRRDLDADVEYPDTEVKRPDHGPEAGSIPVDSTAVNEDEEAEAEAGLAPDRSAAPPADVTSQKQSEHLPNHEQPSDALRRIMNIDDVTEKQVVAYAKSIKLLTKDSQTSIADMSDAKIRALVAGWRDTHLPKITGFPK